MVAFERLSFVDVEGSGPQESFADAVAQGLGETPKSLPPRYFYDREGSALFEAITDLPEYYPTRTEASILETYASEIVGAVGDSLTMVEFGSGSSRKTRLLIEAVLARQADLRYVPIDISRAFLRESSETLLGEYSGLSITALAGEYFAAAEALPSASGPRLILFLGSNIGNLPHEEATAFLASVRRSMRPEDRLLVGTDRVKDRATLEAAYDDAQGVTARFNLNLLSRINRELCGRFDLKCFRHQARYDATQERIEMRLISLADQTVWVEGLDRAFDFEEGESILTEWSQKYTLASFGALCAPAGLEVAQTWTDERGWFTEHLLRPVPMEGG